MKLQIFLMGFMPIFLSPLPSVALAVPIEDAASTSIAPNDNALIGKNFIIYSPAAEPRGPGYTKLLEITPSTGRAQPFQMPHDADHTEALQADTLAITERKTVDLTMEASRLQLAEFNPKARADTSNALDSRQTPQVCVDLFELANFNGAAMYNQCFHASQCITIIDQINANTMLTLGSIRMAGSTTCVVFESANCDLSTARETVTEKNMVSWPPIIPVTAWRASFTCARPN